MFVLTVLFCELAIVLTSGCIRAALINVEMATTNSPLPADCGRRPTHRIIGGRSVSPELWPWLVTLRTSWGSAFCGGTLITNRHVLTAAHCLDPFRRKQYKQLLKIAMGLFERQTGEDILLDVESFILHPQFGETQMFHNDIGIITVTGILNSIMTVCLPLENESIFHIHNFFPKEQSKFQQTTHSNISAQGDSVTSGISAENNVTRNVNDVPDNETTTMAISSNYVIDSDNEIDFTDYDEIAPYVDYDFLEEQYQLKKNISLYDDVREVEGVILGWGRLKEYDRLSETLQQAEIILLNQTMCQNAYGNVYDSELMLCGGRVEGGIDSCQGDSGGPLLIKNKNETWTQIGVVSFGFGCGSPNFPGVYTNVSNYINWIEATIRND